jgi:hypothetical protein
MLGKGFQKFEEGRSGLSPVEMALGDSKDADCPVRP